MIRTINGKKVLLAKCRYCSQVMRFSVLKDHVEEYHPQEWERLQMHLRQTAPGEVQKPSLHDVTSLYVARRSQRRECDE